MPELTDQEWADRAIGRWVNAATAELCPEARARIHAEAQGRFSDAVISGIAAGAGEATALAEAEKALGDPQAARRAYGRIYLDKKEAARVRSVIQPPTRKRQFWHWGLSLFFCSVLALLLSLPVLHLPHNTLELTLTFMLLSLALVHALLPVAWRLARRVPAGMLVSLTFASDILLYLWLIPIQFEYVLRSKDLPFEYALIVVFTLSLAFGLYQCITLGIKLHRHPESAAVLAPPAAVGG